MAGWDILITTTGACILTSIRKGEDREQETSGTTRRGVVVTGPVGMEA